MIVVAAGEPFALSPSPRASRQGPPSGLPPAKPSWLPAASLPPGVEATDRPGTYRASLPGVLSLGGQLVLVLHRAFRPPSASQASGPHPDEGRAPTAPDPNDTLVHALRHLRVLSLYASGARTSVKRSFEELALHSEGQGEDLLDALEAGLALWADRVQHGPLILAERQTSERVPGRIHWQRSLIAGTPVQGVAGEVYRRVIRQRVRRSGQHPLTRLHAATLYEIARRFGLGSAPRADPISGPAARDVLTRHAREVFSDRPARVVALLQRYHRPRARATHERNPARTPTRALLATHYEQVWEQMLQVALAHEADPQQRDAFKGDYQLPTGASVRGLNLKPDLITRAHVSGPSPHGTPRRPLRLVLDAKDYEPGAWPKTGDVAKQILYRLMLSDRIYPDGDPLEAIGNAFLFPSSDPALTHRGTHRLQRASALQIAGAPGVVAALNVPLPRVATAYLAGRPDLDLLQAVADATWAATQGAAAPPNGLGFALR